MRFGEEVCCYLYAPDNQHPTRPGLREGKGVRMGGAKVSGVMRGGAKEFPLAVPPFN